jgi:dimethylaniline monooxygenase (N-oxide forming)
VARTSNTSMTRRSPQLSIQSPLDFDAVVFATGWETSSLSSSLPSSRPSSGYLSPGKSYLNPKQSPGRNWTRKGTKKFWIYILFSKVPHKYVEDGTEYTPFRLFRGLVPPTLAADDRNIVLLGKLENVQRTTLAKINTL